MKQKVYIQVLNKGCYPCFNEKGDLFDLRAGETVDMDFPQSSTQYTSKDGQKHRDVTIASKKVGLGVRMLLPEGCIGKVYLRSGTYDKFGVILANHTGIIDHSYSGPNDEWKVNLIALNKCHIEGPRPALVKDRFNNNLTIIEGFVQGDRIAQVEICLSPKATIWQKLKYLLSSGFEYCIVDNIDTVTDRGGFNSTGTK